MLSSSKLKSVDFYRKIPRDLTEASLSGAGLSIIAALAIIFLFGMELNSYLSLSTSTAVVIDKSPDGEFLRIDFNMSFPALSCEFASVDVSDVLGTNRLNITKTIRKFSIDSHLRPIGPEFLSGPNTGLIKHDDGGEEDYGEGSVVLNGQNFQRLTQEHDILVVNFYAPWCYWSKRLKPSWEKTAMIVRERHDPEADGRILLGKVDCTEQVDLCRRHHVQGYPSIRVFRKGSDVKNSLCQLDSSFHFKDLCWTDDRYIVGVTMAIMNTNLIMVTVTLILLSSFMESLVSPIPLANQQALALDDKSGNKTRNIKRPAPSSSGCRIEGFVRVKKVPGNLIVSAHSGSHSFDASKMNMSHVVTHLSFGKRISPRVIKDVKRIIPYLGESHDRLSGRSYITQDEASDGNVTIEHYLQVVKTEVRASNEHTLVEEYEYTAHSSLVQSPNVPVTKFHFELSPMQVLITENSRSFSHFLTNICAIIGGVFTVAGILDSILHNTMRLIKKVELGKNF